MANMNIRKPRFYCDLINYQMSRGKAQQGNFDVIATDSDANIVGLETGTESELFDMRPLNLVTFDTTTDSGNDHVIITIDTGDTSLKQGFIAILNHNLESCSGKFQVKASDTESHINNDDLTGGTAVSLTEVVNGDTISSNVCTPATDGSTIVTFTERDERFFGIQFEGDSSFDGTTKLSLGCIMIGEFYDIVSPNVDVGMSIVYDKVSQQESIGGQRYSNMSSHGRTVSATSKSPFSTSTSNLQTFGGRIIYTMSFDMNSSDLMPTEYDIYNPTADSFVEDVWERTNGSHLPFLFSCDNASAGDNAESEHIFARFGQNSLDAKQVALDRFQISLNIQEEF